MYLLFPTTLFISFFPSHSAYPFLLLSTSRYFFLSPVALVPLLPLIFIVHVFSPHTLPPIRDGMRLFSQTTHSAIAIFQFSVLGYHSSKAVHFVRLSVSSL